MKRLFALLLCTCILFFCVAAPAFASETKAKLPFTDAENITHTAECALFYELGVISGDTAGAFRPDRNLTRAEVAVLVTALSLGAPDADACTASDVYAGYWAQGYIGYVLESGYLTLANGCYRPNDLVSVRDFCCVLLRVIGYHDLTAETLEAQIAACNLLSGYSGTLDALVTRDEACLLMYNAVCNLEVYEQNGEETLYYTDALLNPVTYLENRFGVSRYTEVVTGNGYADLTAFGTHLEQGLTKLAEHRAFEVESDLSVLGHKVDIIVRNGEVIGLPLVSMEETTLHFTSYEDYVAFGEENGYTSNDATAYYRNYDQAGLACLQEDAAAKDITAIDRDGDQIYDAVLVTVYENVTIDTPDPLKITLKNGAIVSATAMEDDASFQTGDKVFAAEIAGLWYVKN